MKNVILNTLALLCLPFGVRAQSYSIDWYKASGGRTRTAWMAAWLGGVLWAAVQSSPAQQAPYYWQQLQTASPATGGAYMVYDAVRQEEVLLAANGTWLWTGPAWTFAAATPVSLGSVGGMVFDTRRGVAVVYCAVGQSGTPGQTWEWDGTTWNLINTNGPPSVYRPSMSYDSKRDRTVLMGGAYCPGCADQSTTYEWDGSNWLLVSSSGPPARDSAYAAYDTRHGVTVLFGGSGGVYGVTNLLGDTWTWDGVTWTLAPSYQQPELRQDHVMVYDSTRDRVLLFGGRGNDSYIGHVYEWDGAAWAISVIAAVGPPGRAGMGMAYDPIRKQALMFGGVGYTGVTSTGPLGDTWILYPNPIWVDYAWSGAETGDFATPFSNLTHAATAVFPAGFIAFKPGTGTEHLTVSQPMTLLAPLGPVTIH